MRKNKKIIASVIISMLLYSLMNIAHSVPSGQYYNGDIGLIHLTPIQFDSFRKHALIDYEQAVSWSKGASYLVSCDDCQQNAPLRLWGYMNLPENGTDKAGNTAYDLDDHFKVSASLQLTPTANKQVYLPFRNIIVNQPIHPLLTDSINSQSRTDFYPGIKGTVTLMLKKLFVGEYHIPPTLIARLYAVKNDRITEPDLSTPVANLIISGDVTIKNSCQLTMGTPSIDLTPIPYNKLKSQPINWVNNNTTGAGHGYAMFSYTCAQSPQLAKFKLTQPSIPAQSTFAKTSIDGIELAFKYFKSPEYSDIKINDDYLNIENIQPDLNNFAVKITVDTVRTNTLNIKKFPAVYTSNVTLDIQYQ